MRANRILLVVVAVALMGVTWSEPRVHPIRAQSNVPSHSQSESGAPATQELHCGLWRVDGGFVSTIRIKNSLMVAPLGVSPVLYMADGTEYSLPPARLAVSGVATVNVNEALAAAPPEIRRHLSAYGSAALRYDYSTPGHVLGSIEILDTARSLIYTYPFSGVAEGEPGLQTMEGVWWRHMPEVSGFITLSNTTAAAVTAEVQLIASRGGEPAPQVLGISAHGTVLLELDNLAAGLRGFERQAGGVRVQFAGSPGDLIVAGGLLNERIGYSANMPFWGRAHHEGDAEKITSASVGIMVGDAEPGAGFPAGTRFIPYAVLRNTTDRPLNVEAAVNYMAGADPVTRALPGMRLAPLETRQLRFENGYEALVVQGLSGTINVTASFEGLAGDLVIATGSTDQSGTYVFEVEPQGIGKSFSKEGHYWKAADGFDTMFTLWNPTDQAQDFLVTFFYGEEGRQFKFPVNLGPKASGTIDVFKIIAAQQADEDGNIIPLGTREGSVVFSDAQGMTEWMTLAVSIGILNVQTATCGTECTNCCGYTNFRVTPTPGYCEVGFMAQCGAEATYCSGYVYSFTQSSSWSSTDTSILTVNNTTQKGLVTGVSPGTANVVAVFPLSPVYTGPVCGGNPCPTGTPGPGGPVTAIKVLTETVATSPTDRTRKKVGVGEQVTMTLQPTSLTPISWSISGSGTLSATSGNPVTFTAYDRASNPSITATYATKPYAVTFNVVEPNGVMIEQELGTNVWHDYGTVSCGFKGRPYIQPTDVSFKYILVREGTAVGVGIGYFAPENGLVHEDGPWIPIGDVVADKGSKESGIDTISGGPWTRTPYADGTFSWNIPWLFKVGTGAEKQFVPVASIRVTDSTGKLTVTKGGTQRSKNLNDPPSTY